jgi:hypothetical protein
MAHDIRFPLLTSLVLAAASILACGETNQSLARGDGNRVPGSGSQGGTAGAGGDTGSGGTTGGAGSTVTGTSGGSGGVGGGGPVGTGGSNDDGGGSGGAGGVGAGGNGGSAGRGGTAGTDGTGGSGIGTGGSGAGGIGTGGSGAGGIGTGGSGAGGIGTGGSGAGGTGAGGSGTGGSGAGGSAGTGGSGTGGSGAGGGTADGGGTVDTLHFAVYGDTRTGSAMHQSVIDQIAKLDPDLVIHSGDLWDGYTPATFASILTKNANIANLLNNGLYVVSRGNHETVADYLAFKPSLARGNTTERFSYTAGNSFFVVLGMDPASAATFLEGELKKPEATAARWRFVQSHYPVYSGGTSHGASGIPSIEKLCDTYHVAVYWSGHDHIYERSNQVFGGQVVDTGDALSVNKGTVYVVSGGGGAPLYGVARSTTTHVQSSINNYVDVVASPTSLTVKAYKVDGSLVDSYVISQ